MLNFLIGASDAICNIMKLILPDAKAPLPVGVMIPIPQYPLYSATLAEYGAHQVSRAKTLQKLISKTQRVKTIIYPENPDSILIMTI
jgi:aspartate/methionine/tyrosine aminotransferase